MTNFGAKNSELYTIYSISADGELITYTSEEVTNLLKKQETTINDLKYEIEALKTDINTIDTKYEEICKQYENIKSTKGYVKRQLTECKEANRVFKKLLKECEEILLNIDSDDCKKTLEYMSNVKQEYGWIIGGSND